MSGTGVFSEHWDRYEAWFEEHRSLYLAELAAIRRLMPSTPVRGLEVGVGSGRFAGPLGIGIGVEPCGEMALLARQRGVTVLIGTAEDLPFPGACFDVILMVTTICFVDDIRRTFEEAFRVLAPQGCVIVGFVDPDSDLGRKYMAERNSSVFYREATFFSPMEVDGCLKETGFTDPAFVQTLVPEEPEGSVLRGFGRGGFVAVRGIRAE
ncbi:MAG: methyltransferase type 11 [Candidatus Aegiribacteria sp. MLS_C]|nr:MAG: methyltransferase type 11 [Candidatus Aegiribacteria sp. MLS_C]